MRKLATGMPIKSRATSSGFTLIEILVVLLIIGVTIGFALVAFGDFGAKRRLILASEQFVNYVKLVQQQAILEGNLLSIHINQTGYQVFRFQAPGGWQTLSSSRVFHKQVFPANTVVSLKTNGRDNDIQLQASGDMTPFTLQLGSTTEPNMVRVLGKENGTIL